MKKKFPVSYKAREYRESKNTMTQSESESGNLVGSHYKRWQLLNKGDTHLP
ncbi:MAG: hypothetical protein ACJAWQ_001857 [Paraglaciecola sp.]|jgi:hypothetical protein